jgi:hypothetical protein
MNTKKIATKKYNSLVKEIFGPGSLPATQSKKASKQTKEKLKKP